MNVLLTDALPGNGGLVWASAVPTQGFCAPIVGNLLNCSLGNIPAQGSVTVAVKRKNPGCTHQPRPSEMSMKAPAMACKDSLTFMVTSVQLSASSGGTTLATPTVATYM